MPQTVWNVPPLSNIGAVVAAASPGDILVLSTQGGPGLDYFAFQLIKGVTIRGNGARVGWYGTGTPVAVSIPPGQVAHLHGLDLTVGVSPLVPPYNFGCVVQVNGGTVRIESCTFGTYGPVVSIAQADVTLINCVVSLAAGAGVSANAARLTMRDCTIAGASSMCDPHTGCSLIFFPARPALELVSSTLHAERVTLVGGSHFLSNFVANGASALTALNSTVWLADSSLYGGSSGNGFADPALANTGSVPVAMRQVLLVPGSPGGSASAGPVNPNAPLVRMQLSVPWTRGLTSTLLVAGDPGAPYGLWLAPDTTGSLTGVVQQPVFATTGVAITAGLLNGSGDASYSVAVPAIPSLLHATVWCQGFSGFQFPLQATTIAGGLVR